MSAKSPSAGMPMAASISARWASVLAMKGIGYSHPEWGHGLWKGELAMAGESWKCDEVKPMALENQHIQQVVRATCEGRQGIGVLEQIAFGPHARYGFKELLDPA